MQINPLILYFGIILPIVAAVIFLVLQFPYLSFRLRILMPLSGLVLSIIFFFTLPKLYENLQTGMGRFAAPALTLGIAMMVCLSTIVPVNALDDQPAAGSPPTK